MIIDQQLLFLDKNYKILCAEQEYIIHPAVFGFVPLATASLQCSFTSTFQIKDFHLLLEELTLGTRDFINNGIKIATNEQPSSIRNLSLSYTGAILVGADLVKEYYMKGILACFSYQRVVELIFEDGVLITTIDHSKAMSRIRKNIELGLRSLYKKRDARLIKHFISSSFVGDYKTFLFDNSRLNYIKEMKKEYSLSNLPKLNKRIE